MKLYRFSPISSKKDLMKAITYLDLEARKLCVKVYGKELEVAGNIGIFCHYEEEFNYLTQLRQELTDEKINFNNKYYQLHSPIIAENGRYDYLYVRRLDPYRYQVGDVDFVLEEPAFSSLKKEIISNPNAYKYIRSLDRLDIDMLEMFHPDTDIICYIVSRKMIQTISLEKVKV